MTLYITNGDAYNEYLLAQEPHLHALPFREAMMDPTPAFPVFSEEFVRFRSTLHGVSEEAYLSNLAGIVALRNAKELPETLILRFGLDSFCQLNLLTLLSFLESIGYAGEILFSPIDDESFTVLGKDVPVLLGIYTPLYEAVFSRGEIPDETGVIDKHALSLFFDLLSPAGKLARTVRDAQEITEDALLLLLLRESCEYGLSDILAKKLIAHVRNEELCVRTTNGFTVRQAQEEDIPLILAVYARARTFMREAGNPSQWENGYPSRRDVCADLAGGNLFVIEKNRAIQGVFAHFPSGDALYDEITGVPFASRSYTAIHRVASAGAARGVVAAAIEYAHASAARVMIDTHKDNLPMQGALMKLGFRQLGTFFLKGIGERILYEHTRDPL